MTRSRWTYLVLSAAVAGATFLVTMLLFNIRDRKREEGTTHIEVVRLTEDTVEPAEWGKNFRREYDSFRRTAEMQPTKYGGSVPFSRLERNP